MHFHFIHSFTAKSWWRLH